MGGGVRRATLPKVFHGEWGEGDRVGWEGEQQGEFKFKGDTIAGVRG